MPLTDSVERARTAAKGGSAVFGLIAFGLRLVLGVATLLEGHRLIAEAYAYLILFLFLATWLDARKIGVPSP